MSYPSFTPLPGPVPRLLRLLVLLLPLLSLLPGCSNDDDDPIDTPPAGPDKLSVPRAALHPEGIQWDDANQRFIVSSRREGRLGTVKDDSSYTQLADDPRLISTIGVNLDAGRNRVLAAVSDNNFNPARTTTATQRKLAAVAIFNASTGSLISYTDLGSKAAAYPQHFANDIAVDGQGNAYITDSFAPVIYKLDLQGNATVFLDNTQLSGGTGFGLNGIVYHPDGYLLAAKTSDGSLFKIPVNNPAGFTKVTTSQNLAGADGLLLFDNQTLLVVAGSQGTVYRLTSSDSWANASNAGSFVTGAVGPTTITRRSNDAYVLYPYQATSPRFAIVKTRF
ncbi:SMP-30/gluconolactonase/LRE family protein [Hymenobacter sp. 15J16-1T3B]|uniref:SMP-30/gluconolactonase/LRE family protein n=1 Tax=Hymenobacter sp. 15J16-1T3B TaxID=2886941 RepID=UPI001D118551|nr:SMP-30/gluconolactonase/LRE family protein [Hymenobacter sp. 15J16-1T3B]MCC3157980.1 SMP-30/gluconolactonase/LRE family protein [Hymenobacter sp. 15J16-1T3B]